MQMKEVNILGDIKVLLWSQGADSPKKDTVFWENTLAVQGEALSYIFNL